MNRSAIMRAVPSRNTSAELKVRAILRTIMTGYRLHRSDIPGKPDIAFVGRRLAIFVHGCFWHGHDCKRGARAPKTNAEYWRAKIERNVARDALHQTALREQGWRALTIWECELSDADLVAVKLRSFIAAPETSVSQRESRALAPRPKARRGERSGLQR